MYNRLFEIDEWKLIERKLNKENIRLSESLTSLANGNMGIRGNFEEKYSKDHHQGTYMAGVWFPDKTKVGWWKNGYPQYFGKVINSINFIGIDVCIKNYYVDLAEDIIEDFYREIDMKYGILKKILILNIDGKRTKIESFRFLSIVDRELAVINYKITPLNYSEEIKIIPYLDGNVRNQDSNYEENFWIELEKYSKEYEAMLTMKTKENIFSTPRFEVCAHMKIISKQLPKEIKTVEKNSFVSNELIYDAKKNESIEIQKFIVVSTSRNNTDVKQNSNLILNKILKKGIKKIIKEHENAWEKRWEIADVEIKGDKEAQQGIRYNIFHLFSTYYGEDPNLNIGPKGFTGEKYGGATYWDTEAYVIPMYLSITPNEVCKNLLTYRFNQLKEAYINASQQGLNGALFPMVTFTGIECHNEWEITFEEIHRNGAIAFAIYNYTNYTKDESYLKEKGIFVLVGISEFWQDRVHWNKEKKCYMIHGVTGPNEYENNVNNNWYTNYIAKWTLEYTLHCIKKYKDEIKIDFKNYDLDKWAKIASNMYLPYDEKRSIFVQHDTFLDKELKTVDTLEANERPLNQNWSWDKILRSCFIKQADVLQGLYFFNDRFTFEEKKNNFEFYEPMTVHESSLSASIHSILAAEIGKYEKALELYNRTSRLDLDNYNNDTQDGLHITSMTGSWLAIVHGFAQMKVIEDTISFNPFLPKNWEELSFKILFRDRLLKIKIDENSIFLYLENGKPLNVLVCNQKFLLEKEIKKIYKNKE